MAVTVQVRINAADVITGLDDLAAAIPIINRHAIARIRHGLRSIVIDSLEIAMDSVGDAFHPIYQRHLRYGMSQVYPEVFETNDGLIARYYSIENLGDYATLREGFHYHAILDVPSNQFSVTNPPRVELPYTGQALHNEQEDRYEAWQSVVAGQPFEVEFGGGINPKTGRKTPSHKQSFPTAGLYEETLRARVAYWGNTFPEWLVLEYGSQGYEPVVPPTHFKYYTEQRIYDYMHTTYEEVGQSIVDAWNRQGNVLNSANQIINRKTGRFEKILPENY